MSNSGRVSTRLVIPQPAEAHVNLIGMLEQLAPNQPTSGRKLALILHGTMGHRDYLFQKRLAMYLPIDSFRFDFRGNHESGGVWKQGNLLEDIEDLQVVVNFLKHNYDYVIELVVGHSRGSIIAFRWLTTSEDGRNVPAFVNASGRYRMSKILETPHGVAWEEDFTKQGYFTWNVTVARKQVSAKIRPEDLHKFVTWDTSFVWDRFPQETDVLSIHGLSDKTVPPYDALIYARALGDRSPGTHTLYLMEDADHNFSGRQEDVVAAITQWWDIRQRKELVTGVWVPGIKGKL
ncbi:ectomycorrhiza-regulated esterase [Crepidotus variabilis]|uniref:Ectomycorrhiza-regulated esterase n=1 Tax=Crepidotus variabilis TaxID=179855 RepID=A0A9P6E4U3_9AGAR|nr:ectomycorrhiza-regulated esterase [Crepidotus variabilis]